MCSFVFIPHLTVTNFNLNYFFFLPSFILLNQNPFVSLFFCTFFLFPWLPLSLRCTLSISPSISLSVSLTLFLSFSFCFHLCLPSFIPHPPHSGFYLFSLSSVFHLSLPFKHAIPSCCFFSVSYLWSARERAREREKSFICCPYQFCIFNHFPFTQSPVPFPLAQSLIYMCARRSGQLFSAHPWAASLFVRLSEEGLACKELQDESNLILCVLISQRLLQRGSWICDAFMIKIKVNCHLQTISLQQCDAFLK